MTALDLIKDNRVISRAWVDEIHAESHRDHTVLIDQPQICLIFHAKRGRGEDVS